MNFHAEFVNIIMHIYLWIRRHRDKERGKGKREREKWKGKSVKFTPLWVWLESIFCNLPQNRQQLTDGQLQVIEEVQPWVLEQDWFWFKKQQLSKNNNSWEAA